MNKGYVYAAAFVIIALLIAYLLGCNHGKRQACPPNKDTVSVKHDTVWTEVKKDTQYIPKWDTIVHQLPVAFYVTDTLYLESLPVVDTLAILKDYFAKVVYNDTLHLFDGYVLIKDTISQNRIAARQFIANFRIPHDSTTVILHQPKRNLFYIGAGVYGNNSGSILKGVSTSLAYKSKNDYIYELSTSFIQYNKPLYEARFKLPIKLRK